ncbi:Oxidoreductase [Phlyctochytrium planicorne]|nr:Oxidoreductase [Phlyctochytrium planicorne]
MGNVHSDNEESSSTEIPISNESSNETKGQEAFNEETGEINWDCPCLGDMTKPPCGDAFKAAFSCFVYSKEEPKGLDCIEQFRAMQECFRQHPDIYGPDLTKEDLDDEDDEEEDAKSEKKAETKDS